MYQRLILQNSVVVNVVFWLIFFQSILDDGTDTWGIIYWGIIYRCLTSWLMSVSIYFQSILDDGTDPWGIKVERVEV